MRTAVVTGGTKGIGRAIVGRLVGEGYHVAIAARTASDLQETKDAMQNLNPDAEVIVFAADLSKKEEVKRFSEVISGAWEHVDVLVNNAGIFIPGEVLKEEDGVLEQMMNIHVYGTYHLTRFLHPMILRSDGAHIFNMCSIASIIAYPNGGSYSIAKFAQLGFSKVLREELKASGVKVTAVIPGSTWSYSWRGADFPDERLMQPSDIAEAVMSALAMTPSACVEEIIIRPQLGDLPS